MIRIRAVRPSEGARLREIAIASKAHWGYELERVREWAAGGDYTDEALARDNVYVAEADGRAVAWAALRRKDDDACWLEDLWVEPEWIGKGVGTELFELCRERARELGATRLEWEAEPNSVGFYEKRGGRVVDDSRIGSWGRPIPLMELDL